LALLKHQYVCCLPRLSAACTDTISELKLGNGTSVLIFANIASSLPSSVGALLAQNTESNPSNVAIYGIAFFLTTLGIIYVQEAERRIPVNYSSRCAGV
jgi:preprotein translocase subunit SecY